MKRQSDGFSLVEVIIAIAVLAIVAMSLLLYFSNAGRYAESGKTKQRADMAAQSVVEELASYTNYEQIEKNLIGVSGSEWVVKSSPNGSENAYRLFRTGLEVDDMKYDASVKLDFNVNGTYEPSTTQVPAYNDYEVPQIEKVYSENNVVLEETDQTEVAEADIYYQIYNYYIKNNLTMPSITKEDIRAGMTREIHISIGYADDSEELYLVRGNYDYKYVESGKTYLSTTSIKDVKIEKDALKKVYLFYKQVNDGAANDALDIIADSSVRSELTSEESEFSIYMVLQKAASVTDDTLSGYTLNTSGVFPELASKIHRNFGSDDLDKNLITKTKKRRIADVTVEIYREGEADSGEDPVVTVHTSKGA